MLNLILFGAPGSGKGTQAETLVKHYNLYHISTGDMFRYEMNNSTELGLRAKSYMEKGELVPDQVTIDMLRSRVIANPNVDGFIFDGFPRTIPQAQALDALLKDLGQSITKLVSLAVPEEEIVTRILNRGKDSGRPDDNDESIIRKRINVYTSQTSQVFDYYKGFGKSVEIDGVGTLPEVFNRLCLVIDKEVAKNVKKK